MDFTREPIIETIITPKEGYKLVVRSSTSAGQEEHLVDAVEIVAFSHALFFRSLERPKAFLVPVSDYEVLEVREARMVLKNVGLDRSIKIGGGRESNLKASRETEKGEVISVEGVRQEEARPTVEALTEALPEVRVDKKRDRRRHYRKRRGGREEAKEEGVVESTVVPPLEDEKISIPPPKEGVEVAVESASMTPSLLASLLQPPPKLISEMIDIYRQNELFKGAFYFTEEEQYKPHDKVQELLNEEDEEAPLLQEPDFTSQDSFEEESVEPILSEPEKSENSQEEYKETEESIPKIDEESMEEKSSFNFVEEQESQLDFPVYIEKRDESMLADEPSSIPEQEEEKPTTNNRGDSHCEE